MKNKEDPTNDLVKAARAVLRESMFDPKINRTPDPEWNSDRLSVSAALLVRLHKAVKAIKRVK